ncbi:hypothetical protein EV193_103572 [Herbihabitans rhizosphaerae]|uniref:Small secreted protein n=1 Tax=Herbihabitans rhizosphaerae TaxID=1872711 RepID=A0A4Q7KYV8_9PSEU|nr:hypothetical protein [Herbihabitans rhizosphaerae]RZS41251.1 hypothetical protein EV193_103572 [Herbihabitans rhizosphaerae]
MTRRLVAASVLAGLTLSLAACGDSGDNGGQAAAKPADPVIWVGAVCGGIDGSLRGMLDVLKTAKDNPDAAPETQKQAALKLLDTVEPAIKKSKEDMEKSGTPSNPAAAELHKGLIEIYDKSLPALADQRRQVMALDPKDPQFTQKIESIDAGGGAADTQGLREKTKGLENDPELKSAQEKAPGCQKMKATAKEFGQVLGIPGS